MTIFICSKFDIDTIRFVMKQSQSIAMPNFKNGIQFRKLSESEIHERFVYGIFNKKIWFILWALKHKILCGKCYNIVNIIFNESFMNCAVCLVFCLSSFWEGSGQSMCWCCDLLKCRRAVRNYVVMCCFLFSAGFTKIVINSSWFIYFSQLENLDN